MPELCSRVVLLKFNVQTNHPEILLSCRFLFSRCVWGAQILHF